jgi:Flp pilus assembly protein TadD
MKRHAIIALMVSAALSLPLGGCASTDDEGSHAAKIDSALEHAANEASAKGDSQETLALLERIYKRDPANAGNALKYAAALQDAGRSNRSVMVLSPFIQNGKADKNAPLLVEYASVEASVGNYDTAAENARKATLADPKDGPAWHILGIALDAKGSHPEAEDAFRKALQNWQGDSSPVLNNLGLNLASQGFIDEAVDTLKEAVAMAPDRPEIERNLRIVMALQAQPGTHENKRVPTPPRKPGKTAKAGKSIIAAKEQKPGSLTAADKIDSGADKTVQADSGKNTGEKATDVAARPDQPAAPVSIPNGHNT